MAKYDELRHVLDAVSADRVTYTFAEIGEAVGGLPPSASDHREWWANSSSPQARAWMGAGFRVEMVNVASQVVRFVRAKSPRPAPRSEESRASSAPPPSPPRPAAALPGEFDLSVRGLWHVVGPVAHDGDLSFPTVPAAPAIYRFTFTTPEGIDSVYVGESVDVRRRMRNYRKPSPRQQTSTRIHHLLRTRLEAGDGVTLGLLTNIEVRSDQPVPADLTSKAVRVLVEHTALVALAAAGYEVHNL